MAQDHTPQLLEALSNLAGCSYLSDLRTPSYRERLIWALWQLTPEDYPLSQWREAFFYLLHRAQELVSPEQARQALADTLSGRPLHA